MLEVFAILITKKKKVKLKTDKTGWKPGKRTEGYHYHRTMMAQA